MNPRICPHCQKPIEDDEALLCLYCGESLRSPAPFFWKGIIALAVAIAFFLLILAR
jgi:predicted amidophosphoribosyltransferase